jgi:hypothetical protein
MATRTDRFTSVCCPLRRDDLIALRETAALAEGDWLNLLRVVGHLPANAATR